MKIEKYEKNIWALILILSWILMILAIIIYK